MDKKRNIWENSGEFEELYLEYKPKLLQFVITTIINKDIAEDIVQEVFYEAVRQYETFKEHPKQIGWLYKTARYKINECIRKLKQQDEVSLETEQIETGGMEEGYCEVEMEMVISETLTEEELLRFRRYFLWGETIAEMAQKENVTENNMRVRISRLKKKIEIALQYKG